MSLRVSHNNTSHASAGEVLLFTAVAEAPPNMGKIVSLEWDFYGTGGFAKGAIAELAEAVTF